MTLTRRLHLFIDEAVNPGGVSCPCTRHLTGSPPAPRQPPAGRARRGTMWESLMVTWALAGVGGAGTRAAFLTGEICPLPPRSYYTALPVVLLPSNSISLK